MLIIILSFIVLVIVIVLIGIALSRHYKSESVPELIQGEFLSSCLTSDCDSNLTCDPVDFVCRISTNATCSNSWDCISGDICNLTCLPGGSLGGLDDPCPCDPYLVCSNLYVSPVCKVPVGDSCDTNEQCTTNNCTDNVCGLMFNGFPCTTNSDCESNSCSLGFCQASGITTGEVNAMCYSDGCQISDVLGASCNTGLQCDCDTHTCLQEVGFMESCSPGVNVCNNTECLDSSGDPCVSGDCSCSYNFENPNEGVCTSLYQANGSSCLGDTLAPCFNNDNCVSDTCNTSPVIYFYLGNVVGSNELNFNSSIIPSYPGISVNSFTYMSMANYNQDSLDAVYICLSGINIYSVYQLIDDKVSIIQDTNVNPMLYGNIDGLICTRIYLPVNTGGPALDYSLLALGSNSTLYCIQLTNGTPTTLEVTVQGASGSQLVDVNGNVISPTSFAVDSGIIVFWNSTTLWYTDIQTTQSTISGNLVTYYYLGNINEATIDFTPNNSNVNIMLNNRQVIIYNDGSSIISMNVYDNTKTMIGGEVGEFTGGLSGMLNSGNTLVTYLNSRGNFIINNSDVNGVIQGQFTASALSTIIPKGVFMYSTHSCN